MNHVCTVCILHLNAGLFLCVRFQDVESYIHRSGRTGRAGRTGVCICFYQRKEEEQLRYVEKTAVRVLLHLVWGRGGNKT